MSTALERVAAELRARDITIVAGSTLTTRLPGLLPRYRVSWRQLTGGREVTRYTTVWWRSGARNVEGWAAQLARMTGGAA